MAGFENDVLLCSNVNFNPDLPKPHLGLITTNGQLIIGSSALNPGGTHLNIGSLVSLDSTLTIGYSSPNITLSAGSALATQYQSDSGIAIPAANILNVLGSGSTTTTGSGNTLTVALTGLTNHALLVGAGTATITKVGPTATAGQVLQSAGASADPAFSTATFPSTATGTGTILRADGTNWVATTATYPATTTSQQILYSTANNVIGQLTTANSSLAATNSSGTLAMRALSVVIQTFTSNGTYTPTTGMLYCIIEIVGSGGGGGGSAATAAGTLAYGAGGGGGEYARGVFSAATVGASQSVTCPAGGAGATAGNNSGTAGSTTSVGALITAGGGGAGAGAAAATGGISGAPGAGGTGGSGGSFRINGGDGFNGYWIVGNFQIPGRGASSFFSTGIKGSPSTSTGATGSGYGGGGNGGNSFTSAAAQAGGPGSSGLVVITEYVIN